MANKRAVATGASAAVPKGGGQSIGGGAVGAEMGARLDKGKSPAMRGNNQPGGPRATKPDGTSATTGKRNTPTKAQRLAAGVRDAGPSTPARRAAVRAILAGNVGSGTGRNSKHGHEEA